MLMDYRSALADWMAQSVRKFNGLDRVHQFIWSLPVHLFVTEPVPTSPPSGLGWSTSMVLIGPGESTC